VDGAADAKTGGESKVAREAIIGLNGASRGDGGGIYANATGVQGGGVDAEGEKEAQVVVARGGGEAYTGADKAHAIPSTEGEEMVVRAEKLHAAGHLIATKPCRCAEEVTFGVELGASDSVHELMIEEEIASDVEEGSKGALRLVLGACGASTAQQTADDKHGEAKNYRKFRSVQEAPPKKWTKVA